MSRAADLYPEEGNPGAAQGDGQAKNTQDVDFEPIQTFQLLCMFIAF